MNNQPSLSNRHSQLTPVHSIPPRRPRSKIGRLPSDVRELVNQSLREGLSNREISLRLKVMGHEDIIPRNISTWVATGYRQWMYEQTQLQTSLAQAKATLDELGRSAESGSNLPRFLDGFLATLLQRVFQDFDPDTLKSLLVEKPTEFFRLLQSLNGHLTASAAVKRAELDRARCEVEVSEKAQPTKDIKPPIRSVWYTETLAQMARPEDPVTTGLQRIAAEEEDEEDQDEQTDPTTSETDP